MNTRCVILIFASSSVVWSGQPGLCGPTPEIQAEFQKAAAISVSVTDPFAALEKAAPFSALRDRYPDNLFVHEKYQDAMMENGIEGHLRLLARQYQGLYVQHPGDPLYRYLSLRTAVGRGTFGAIQGLNEFLTENPDFPPAHRTLAEIYGTEAFRDREKEKSEKEKFLASCPGGTFTRRPPSVPGPSLLLDRAQRLLAENGDPDRIIAMTIQGLKEFEWRSQRVRAFDWYSAARKLEDARELRGQYWQAWPIQVRCHRKAGRTEEANQLLAYMEQQAKALSREPGFAYWNAQGTLAGLYAEGKQTGQASQKLAELPPFL